MIELFFIYVESRGLNKLLIDSDLTAGKIKRFFMKHKSWKKTRENIHMYNNNDKREYIILCFSEDYRLIRVKLTYKCLLVRENPILQIT
jgi:hypothetical protein